MSREMQVSRRDLFRGAALFGLSRWMPAMEPPAVIGLESLLDGTAMVRIPSGEFLMGSPTGLADQRPVHKVRISHAFEMGKYEVTQAQWETVMSGAHRGPQADLITADGTRVSAKPSHFEGANLPVESVSWNDVQLFFTRLNARDLRHQYRLPTEAEWEFAARGADPGNTPASLESVAWFKDNSSGQTHAAGGKESNASGLCDIQGNVAEWVQDWFAGTYYAESPKKDPQGPGSGSYRVYRGGSWLDEAKYCGASLRRFDFPNSRVYNVGFRVVRSGR